MADLIPNPDDLVNNKADFVDGEPIGREEQPGGASGKARPFESPIQNSPEEATLLVPKAMAEKFRREQAWSDSFDRVRDTQPSILEVTSKLGSSKEVSDYLKKNQDNLSPEEQYYLKMSAEMRKSKPQEQSPSDKDIEQVELRGENVKAYKKFRINDEFSTAIDKYAMSDDPNIQAVLKVTLQNDPAIVATYMTENWNNLSPAALDLLNASLKVKTAPA